MGKFRREIHNFCQNETETVFEAWERFKEIVQKCQHSRIELWIQLQDFWNDLKSASRRILSNAAGEDLLKSFIIKKDERLDAHGAPIKELSTGLRNLEKQVGQIATILSERILGILHADTEKNPKETVNVVTLKSGQLLKDPTPVQKESVPEKESGEQRKIELYTEKLDKLFERFLDMPRQVNVNLPFTEVLSQMPTYSKFLKEILTKKRKIEETLLVKLTEHCSGILQNKLPQKCGDTGSFTIPCSLGTLNFDKPLCDSGALINLMPLSIYKKLENKIGEIRPTLISLQLVDQTTIIPEGIMKDVLVRVDKFIVSVNFIMVKMEENNDIPIILGRPFLATRREILDIHERKLMLRVGEDTVTFKMYVETG
uniref:Uncharacterized protein LOC104210993 n=1 Tax=Nicotiana sylvestris TaxID=4096 RepID=A0A1U7UZW2_NICSY|nr:PREDICTED: uncharacterized protein LOC104210993 [Nicotiana sylvestris]